MKVVNYFFDKAPPIVIKSLAIALIFSSLGFSFLLGRSNSFTFDKNGLKVERQAVVNQMSLKEALTLIEVQRNQLNRYEKRVESFSNQTKKGKELVSDVKVIRETIPDSKIQEFTETIEQSTELLSEYE